MECRFCQAFNGRRQVQKIALSSQFQNAERSDDAYLATGRFAPPFPLVDQEEGVGAMFERILDCFTLASAQSLQIGICCWGGHGGKTDGPTPRDVRAIAICEPSIDDCAKAHTLVG